MHCQTCKFSSEYRFCAVNPTHMQGGWSKACNEYEHNESKAIKCGNCYGYQQGYCILQHIIVDESGTCMDFIPHDEVGDAYEWNNHQMFQDAMSNIKVSINLKSGKLILLK